MTCGWVGKTAHQRMLQANGYQETEHSGCSSLKSSTSAFSAKNVFCHLTHSRRSFSVFIVFLHSYPESFFLFNMCVWKKKNVCVYSVAQSCLTLQRYWLQPTRLLCPWDFPDKNTGVACHFLFQGISLTQGLNSRPLHCRWILYHWATWECLLSNNTILKGAA